jgi:chemotaxis response regulator CheB
VVGEAGNGMLTVDIALCERPDLVCLDMEMPVLNEYLALEELHAHMPGLSVMMITSLADREVPEGVR